MKRRELIPRVTTLIDIKLLYNPLIPTQFLLTVEDRISLLISSIVSEVRFTVTLCQTSTNSDSLNQSLHLLSSSLTYNINLFMII